MRAPMSLEEFAALTRTSHEEIESYRAAGLLDPDGDGLSLRTGIHAGAVLYRLGDYYGKA